MLQPYFSCLHQLSALHRSMNAKSLRFQTDAVCLHLSAMSRGAPWWPMVFGTLGMMLLLQNLFSTMSLQAHVDDLRTEIHTIKESTNLHTADSGALRTKRDEHLKLHQLLERALDRLKKVFLKGGNSVVNRNA